MKVSDFNDRIIQRFPPSFRWDDVQKASWAEDMVRELSGFSGEVRERAFRQIVATRKDHKTPLVSECITACLEAKRWIDAEKNKGQLPMGEKPASGLDWTADRLKLATDLCMSPMGREAAKDGWVQQLHDFARKNSRLPQPGEIGALKREAKAFDEAYARCVKGGWPQAEKLERLGAMMLKRREDLVDRVLHGVVG
jgi:hypothetical protein